jgi:hypothetical protein
VGQSSAQSYKSQRRFDLIVMTGHAFQVLLTDADALAALGTMRGHLKERGSRSGRQSEFVAASRTPILGAKSLEEQ